MKKIVLIYLVLNFFMGCSTVNNNSAIDYWGSYYGVLPSASGMGIETKILLLNDKYILEEVYLGKSDEVFKTEGKINWGKDRTTIFLDNRIYRLWDKKLEQLDINENEIEGNLKDFYILEKLPHLFNKKWILSEINGDVYEQGERETFVYLEKDNKIYGFSGCNNLMGSFESVDNSISFGPLATTRMACFDGKDEGAFLDLLSQVNNYEINNQTLLLKKDGIVLLMFIL